MEPSEWRAQLSETVREIFVSPELTDFFDIPATPERGRVYISQLSIYVRNRRNYWPQVAANCPEFVVKQRIMAHEHEELVEDDYSDAGHLDLVFRQGKELGLTPQQILDSKPLPTTQACIYGWWWLARTRPWQEGLAASTIAEWINDDRLLNDLGGGLSSHLRRNWERDMNFKPKQMPNFTAHSAADEKHSEMFLDIFEKFVPKGAEDKIIATARESMQLHRVFFGGMAAEMARL